MTYLFPCKNMLVEIVLKLLICYIDAQLLKAVDFEVFKSKDVKDADGGCLLEATVPNKSRTFKVSTFTWILVESSDWWTINSTEKSSSKKFTEKSSILVEHVFHVTTSHTYSQNESQDSNYITKIVEWCGNWTTSSFCAATTSQSHSASFIRQPVQPSLPIWSRVYLGTISVIYSMSVCFLSIHQTVSTISWFV